MKMSAALAASDQFSHAPRACAAKPSAAENSPGQVSVPARIGPDVTKRVTQAPCAVRDKLQKHALSHAYRVFMRCGIFIVLLMMKRWHE